MWDDNLEPVPLKDLATFQSAIAADLQREQDLARALWIETTLDDEGVVGDIRRLVEQQRCFAEAYGDKFTTDDYVRAVLNHTAILLRDRAHG